MTLYKMHSMARVAGLLLLGLLQANAQALYKKGGSDLDDLAVMQRRIAQRQDVVPQGDVPRWVGLISSNGTWPDIDYLSVSTRLWPTLQHAERMLAMSACYANASCPLHSSALLLNRTLSALDWWISTSPTDEKWWKNTVSGPLLVGAACNVLDAARNLSSVRREGCAAYLQSHVMKSAQKSGNANGAWEYQGVVYRGLLQRNATLVKSTLVRIWAHVTPGTHSYTGVQPDWSFSQHGTQSHKLLQVGLYGTGLLMTLAEHGYDAAGTAYAMPPDAVAALTRFALDGLQWFWVGLAGHPTNAGYDPTGYDIPALGRRLVQGPVDYHQAPDPNALHLPLLRRMPTTDAARLAAWVARVAFPRTAPPLVGNRHFFSSDYMVHRRPTWFASVKMFSQRTFGGECVNGEGIQSGHFSDGVNYLWLTGTEYVGCPPAWNWDQLPGSTVEQGLVRLTCKNAKNPGPNNFVGGVSDGTNGVAAYRQGPTLRGSTLRGCKAWMMFTEGYVALGAGLNTTSAAPVATTIAQQRLAGPVHVSSITAPAPMGTTSVSLDASQWLHHAQAGEMGVGVHVSATDGAEMRVALGNQTGSWESVNEYFNGTVTVAMYRPVIYHRDRYSFTVVPGVSLGEFAATLDKNFAILSNSPQLQAVWSRSDQTLGAVFWEAGALSTPTDPGHGRGLRVAADAPCAVLVDLAAGVATVADPTQRLDGVGITVGGRTHAVKLPRGDQAGASVAVQL